MNGVIGVIIASALAIGSSRLLLHGSVWSLIPWAVLGIALGYVAKTRKEALSTGAAYGFIISFIFMWLGYSGTAPIVTRIPFFAVLGLFGAVCGLILSFVGFFAKKLLQKQPH